MILKRIKLDAGIGDPTNCYIIMDKDTKEAIVIDPGAESEKIIEMLNALNAKIKYIYLTHCHGDHIGAITELKQSHGGKTITYVSETEGFKNEGISLTYVVGMDKPDIDIDSRLHNGDIIHIGKIEFELIHTPGHTAGSSCLYCKEYKMLFSGDTLFKGTWGRTDLPTGSFEDIINSITNKLMILPEDTIVYPGHGRFSIIRDESSIYLNLKRGD